MNREDHVCSLDHSEKLSKLDVENWDTLFVWGKGPGDKWTVQLNCHEESEYCQNWPTYTSSELGVMLPDFVTKRVNGVYDFELVIKKDGESFKVSYIHDDECPHVLCESIEDTEAEAKAEILIWLILNKYLKPETVKV